MKRLLCILSILALSVCAFANEIRRVPVTMRLGSDNGLKRVDAEAQFRESRATLSITLDSTGDHIAGISGTLDGAKFKVNVRAFRKAMDFKFEDVAMHADCCVNGYAVSWQVPFGAATECLVDTPEGRKPQLVHSVIYITIDQGGTVRRAKIIGC